MGIGVISISTSQKKDPSGSPFTLGSLHNGLSIDLTGKGVLGNDLGDAAQPARLLDNREIQVNDGLGGSFTVTLSDIIATVITVLSGNSISITGNDFTAPTLSVQGGISALSTIQAITGDGGVSAVVAQTGDVGMPFVRVNNNNVEVLDITAGNGNIVFTVGFLFTIISINVSNLSTQITGGTPQVTNGAALQVSGTCTKRLFPQGQGAGTYNIDRDLDSSKLFINSGALVLALPNMVGSSNRPGFYFDVYCANVAGVTIDADAGATIHFGSLTTATGGTLFTTDLGATIRIILINSTTWATSYFTGAWQLT